MVHPGGYKDHASVDRAVQRGRPVRPGQLRVLRPGDRPHPPGEGRVDMFVQGPAAAPASPRPGGLC